MSDDPLDDHQLKALLAQFDTLPDPRQRRGRRHRIGSVIHVAVCGVMAGAKSLLALGEWANDLSQESLERLGCRFDPKRQHFVPPSAGSSSASSRTNTRGPSTLGPLPSTFRVPCAWTGRCLPGTAAGKETPDSFLTAFNSRGIVLAPVPVAEKSNEIPAFRPLLAPLDLEGIVVTADAMNTQRDPVAFLVEEKKAYFVLTVKKNQPSLYNALACRFDSLAPAPLPTQTVREVDKGHGRLEVRELSACSDPDLLTYLKDELDFPHIRQVARLDRQTTLLKTGKIREETVYLIACLPPGQDSPEAFLNSNRRHWSIENRLHWVRDVVFGEDLSTIRTGTLPRMMTNLRNLALFHPRTPIGRVLTSLLRSFTRKQERVLDFLAL